MSQYLLSNYQPHDQTLEPGELQRVVSDVVQLTREMQEAGVWVFSMPLADAASSSVVRSAAGKVSVADGPFTEAKEYVGGFTVIDVSDLDAALRWAGKVAAATALPIEVRPAPRLPA